MAPRVSERLFDFVKLVAMRRRDMLTLPAVAAVPEAVAKAKTALSLNEDNSHFFFTRAGRDLTVEQVASFVDQYANTQVRELLFSPNSQRTSFASEVWDPIWKGYDPAGADDQALFASTAAEARPNARKWVHTAWSLNNRGIDVYAVWLARARRLGISPWLSMRMNDLHNVDDADSYMHSTFWRANPQFRRMQWREADWRDRAFDYAHREVRDYHFGLIEEYVRRYDFDGLELDWMRFGFHFAPGREEEGAPLLTEFMQRTRALLRAAERRRGYRIRLSARIPSRPETARRLGLDGAAWARAGLVDALTITPFWASIETDMPIELWRSLCGPNVKLCAGLEVLLRPYHSYRPLQMNSLETVRGAAASLLARGADRIYLFNYMDSQTAMEGLENYPVLLRECGALNTLRSKPRRHILTYADTWAPGEPQAAPLPKRVARGEWAAFRVPVGPAINAAEIRLELEGAQIAELRVNGRPCRPVAASAVKPPSAARGFTCFAAEAPVWGEIVIDLRAAAPGQIHWVEVAGQ